MTTTIKILSNRNTDGMSEHVPETILSCIVNIGTCIITVEMDPLPFEKLTLEYSFCRKSIVIYVSDENRPIVCLGRGDSTRAKNHP